ncbi:Serine/threonine-protein kinase Nek1, partial [Tetrabaena socialis]
EKLFQYVPCLKPAYLDELLEWQSDALALRFAPKQHRVVEKNETVPFKGVRQPGGIRSGAVGRVIKVREAGTELFFARKSGDIKALAPELDILRGLPPSDHNVSLRASYVKDGSLHLVVRPWAKTDLSQFISNPEVLPGWATGENVQKSALIVGWLNCLAVGLAKLHAQHIKHKDIKPANILLADTSEDDYTLNACPVFCDFGLSKLFSEQSKTVGGGCTPYYQAPEQLEGRHAGRAADVFSLGCVFLELAFMLANKKRKKLTKRVPTGFASSPEGVGDCIAQLPTSTFWTGLKEV